MQEKHRDGVKEEVLDHSAGSINSAEEMARENGVNAIFVAKCKVSHRYKAKRKVKADDLAGGAGHQRGHLRAGHGTLAVAALLLGWIRMGEWPIKTRSRAVLTHHTLQFADSELRQRSDFAFTANLSSITRPQTSGSKVSVIDM